MSAVGVVVAGGSADERGLVGTVGGAALAEVCAWRGTAARDAADVLRTAEACGAYLHANAQREQTLCPAERKPRSSVLELLRPPEERHSVETSRGDAAAATWIFSGK